MSQDITVKSAAQKAWRTLHEPLERAPAGSVRPYANRHGRLAAASTPIHFFLMADQAGRLRASEAPGMCSLRARRPAPATAWHVFVHSSRMCGEHEGSLMV